MRVHEEPYDRQSEGNPYLVDQIRNRNKQNTRKSDDGKDGGSVNELNPIR